MITTEQIKQLDKLFAKDARGETPKRISDEDHKRLAEEFSGDKYLKAKAVKRFQVVILKCCIR